MSSWLIPETKAILSRTPPGVFTPAASDAFTLIALTHFDPFETRVIRAITRILQTSEDDARMMLQERPPFKVRDRLTYAEAINGQFELVCCNAISIFIPDEIFQNASQTYLEALYRTTLQSAEFQTTRVQIGKRPNNC